MKRNIWVFGTISGVIVSAFMGTSMAIMGCGSGDQGGGITSMVIGFSGMVAAFTFIFVGIKNFRDKQNGGTITFGKGFFLGLMISLIASTLYVLTWAVEYHFFFPDFMDKYAGMQIKQLQESGVAGRAYEEAIAEIETGRQNYRNPLFFAMYTYAEILPVGIIITLISAAILRKKTPAIS